MHRAEAGARASMADELSSTKRRTPRAIARSMNGTMSRSGSGTIAGATR
ncbi:hypothetical protein [Nannocystis pusilla]